MKKRKRCRLHVIDTNGVCVGCKATFRCSPKTGRKIRVRKGNR